ncbi:MAG: glycosyltransferase family 4 protein [Reinekea sp.]
MQRAFNMLKECSQFSEIDFVSLLPVSEVTAYYPDFQAGILDIKNNLSQYCRSLNLIPHGVNGRKFNKYLNAARSLLSSYPYDVVALKSSSFQFILESCLENNHYDLIYVDTIGLSPYLDNISAKVILNHHNVESHMLERRAALDHGLLSLYLRWQAKKTMALEKKFSNRFQLNFTCSELDSQRLKAITDCKTVSIPNGVDLTYFSRKKPYVHSNTKGIIFAGGLEWYPNTSAIDFIVDEIEPKLSESKLMTSITIYGKGSHKKLEKRSVEAGSLVSKGGFVDDIRVPMESARMYICPIKDGGGTKLKILDALAMGIPLIANPVACEGIDVENGKHVIFAETPEEYLTAISRLNEDSRLCEEMSRAGIKLIEQQYSYKHIGNKIQKAMEELVNEPVL